MVFVFWFINRCYICGKLGGGSYKTYEGYTYHWKCVGTKLHLAAIEMSKKEKEIIHLTAIKRVTV